jgi:hypothetical protein
MYRKLVRISPDSDFGFVSAYKGILLEQGCIVPRLGHSTGSQSAPEEVRVHFGGER